MLTKEKLYTQLQAMHLPQNTVVLMHCSLKAIGEVEGRGEGLLQMLIDYVTADGGVFCVPTHTWACFGENFPYTLDLQQPYSCVGAFSRLALQRPDGIRSRNITHSVVAFGDPKKIEALFAGEETFTHGTDPRGFYAKLAEQNGAILLVGVKQERNTYLHCVEEMYDLPNRTSPEPHLAKVRYPDGRIEQREVHTHIGGSSEYFPKLEPAFRYHGCITDGMIGEAPTQLCDAKKQKDTFGVIVERAKGQEFLRDDRPLPTAWYE